MTPEKELTPKLLKDSGHFETEDPLVVFLYLLMRDKLTPGEVSTLLHQTAGRPDVGVGAGYENRLTNGWLAQYADWLARELRVGDS